MFRNTSTGLFFEQKVVIHRQGIDLTKHKMYKYLTENKIDWRQLISRKLLPDEAYFDENTKELFIYEKKYQQVEGSTDEKPQTCGFKIWEFSKIGQAIGAKTTYYIYIFNDWFHQSKYKDMLEYIKSIPNCNYYFEEEINAAK